MESIKKKFILKELKQVSYSNYFFNLVYYAQQAHKLLVFRQETEEEEKKRKIDEKEYVVLMVFSISNLELEKSIVIEGREIRYVYEMKNKKFLITFIDKCIVYDLDTSQIKLSIASDVEKGFGACEFKKAIELKNGNIAIAAWKESFGYIKIYDQIECILIHEIGDLYEIDDFIESDDEKLLIVFQVPFALETSYVKISLYDLKQKKLIISKKAGSSNTGVERIIYYNEGNYVTGIVYEEESVYLLRIAIDRFCKKKFELNKYSIDNGSYGCLLNKNEFIIAGENDMVLININYLTTETYPIKTGENRNFIVKIDDNKIAQLISFVPNKGGKIILWEIEH